MATPVQTSSLWMFAGGDDDDGLMDFDTGDVAAAADTDDDTEAFIANAQAQLEQLQQQQAQFNSVQLVADSQANMDDDFNGSWDEQQANAQRFQQVKDITMLARLAGEKKKQVQQQVEKFQQWNPTMYVKQTRETIEAMPVTNATEMTAKDEMVAKFNAMIQVRAD